MRPHPTSTVRGVMLPAVKRLFGAAIVGLIAASLAVHNIWLFLAALGVGFAGAGG